MPAACLNCEHFDQGFPCRTNGTFDAAKMAQVYMDEVIRKDGGEGGSHWSFTCIDVVCKETPEDAWRFIQETLPLLETDLDAAVFAAGPLEVLIADSGEMVIDKIETLSRQSPRFRYLLTGVWPLGKSETDIWTRVEKNTAWRRAHRPRSDASGLKNASVALTGGRAHSRTDVIPTLHRRDTERLKLSI